LLKTIYIDISEIYFRDANTGIQRAVKSLIKNFFKKEFKNYNFCTIYGLPDGSGYKKDNKFLKKFLNNSIVNYEKSDYVFPKPGDIFFGLDFSVDTVLNNSNFFNFLKIRNVKIYFMLYDLLPIQFPNFWNSEFSLLHEKWVKRISQYDGILCTSKTVCLQLINFLNKNSINHENLNIDFVHHGYDQNNFTDEYLKFKDKSFNFGKLLKNPTFLVIGTLESRKAHELVLNAFDILWKRGFNFNLIFIGKKGWLVDKLIGRIDNHYLKNIQFYWFNEASDRFIKEILKKTTCLIHASLAEGFGLSLLDAIAHGVPIIARDIPVTREICGDNCFYFTTNDPNIFSDAILEWHNLYLNNSHPRVNSIKFISWNESARRTINYLTSHA
jgi:glycosyltransferase involved in cell wall biosynthesis